MDKLAEKLNVSKSGLYVIMVLIIAIGGSYFLLPNKNNPKGGKPTIKTGEKVADGISAAQPSAEAGVDAGAATPAAPVVATPAAPTPVPAAPTAALVAAIPAQPDPGLRERIGRVDPFAPVSPSSTTSAQAAFSGGAQGVVYPPLDLSNMKQDFNFPLVEAPLQESFKMPVFDARPAISVTAITVDDKGEALVLINNDIVRKGQQIQGTGYYIDAVDTKSMEKITVRGPDGDKFEVSIKAIGQSELISKTPDKKGGTITITNVLDSDMQNLLLQHRMNQPDTVAPIKTNQNP